MDVLKKIRNFGIMGFLGAIAGVLVGIIFLFLSQVTGNPPSGSWMKNQVFYWSIPIGIVAGLMLETLWELGIGR